MVERLGQVAGAVLEERGVSAREAEHAEGGVRAGVAQPSSPVRLILVRIERPGLPLQAFDVLAPGGDDVFDDWEISRTRSSGADGFYQVNEKGFRPVIVYESLGEEADIDYGLGQSMVASYPDRVQRAEQIFKYVRDRVRYTTDKDQFQHDEFAQNADELAIKIVQNGIGHGDCEDSAIMLAVMYKGAGYRSAIAIAPGHTAAIVYLPEFKKGSIFTMNGEEGWIWAEATGRNNHDSRYSRL